ncbi:hypothetical protein H0H87_005070 [Tephrocybe sp. NHM501043]|nr:hypothetical protein H0H87_005070 [Tephrocybe sp. NHM501043]
MALVDWARARILDGHWISPADSWYGHRMPGWEKGWVRAVHPLAWSLVEDVDVSPTSGEEGDGVEDEGEERGQHPTPQTLRQPVPPTFGLCEAAFAAHTRSLKEVLVPPMRNLVRKLVIECQTPGMLASDSSSYSSTNTKRDRGRTEDPAIRAAKMGIEEVLEVLRNEEGVWLEGFDWVGQWRDQQQQQQRQRAPDASGDRGKEEESDDTGSSAGSVASGRSTGTSPVLSTSTLQTTPSPSPIVSDDDVKSSPPSPAVEIILVEDDQDAQQQEREKERAVPLIEVAPVLNPPKPLHTVPYIPITTRWMPTYTVEVVRSAWREACAPLYRCRCSICLRAAAKAHAAAHPQLAQSAQQQQQHWSVAPPPSPPVPSQPREKQQKSPIGDGEDEMENVTDDELDDADDDVDLGVEEYEDPAAEVEGYDSDVVEVGSGSDEELDLREEGAMQEGGRIILLSPAPQQRARKRSSDELELEDVPSTATSPPSSASASARSGTPPKRARVDAGERHRHQRQDLPGGEGRLRKRSSEEVEEGPEGERELEESREAKKCRVLGVEVDEELERMPTTQRTATGIKTGVSYQSFVIIRILILKDIPSHTTTPTSHRTFTLIKELARSNRVNGINGQTEAREM